MSNSTRSTPHPALLPWMLGWLLLWLLWTGWWDSALYGDNVEQFIWAHSMEWGYHKHPPMPTWILGGALALLGPHWWLTNALAGLCFAGTGLFTWLIARRLCGSRVAAVTVVLWGLQQSFSVTVHIYNHNTVLVLWVAALAWCVLRALDSSRHALAWWALGGVLAAGALLSKYQALLPLGALALLALAQGKPGSRVWQGLLLALLICAGLLVPHAMWSVANHFPSLRYASNAIESGSLVHRFSWVLSFFVNQLRMVLPLLLACLLAWAWSYGAHVRDAGPVTRALIGVRSSGPSGGRADVAWWLLALLWGPLFVVVIGSLASGGVLRNHWGVQLCQFVCLWVAWNWRHSAALALPRLLVCAALVQLLGLGYYAAKQSNPLAAQAEGRADAAYPARAMAQAGLALWDASTRCPLRIVAGDFEAGLVSVYSGRNPVIYGDAVSTPWVSVEDVQTQGALYVAANQSDLPAGLVGQRAWALNEALAPQGKKVWMAVQLPATGCN